MRYLSRSFLALLTDGKVSGFRRCFRYSICPKRTEHRPRPLPPPDCCCQLIHCSLVGLDLRLAGTSSSSHLNPIFDASRLSWMYSSHSFAVVLPMISMSSSDANQLERLVDVLFSQSSVVLHALTSFMP